MKKLFSLVKACMTENMSLFKIHSKSKSESSKNITPIILALIFLVSIGSYASMMMEPLKKAGVEILLLSLFVVFTTVMTLVEGVYKSSSLLFDCKDDNLLFSLPIKKKTVLFIRLFKFYVFEFLYNSLFLLPAMVVYAWNVKVDGTYYFASLIALIFIPMIPIILSSIIGGFVAFFSAKFKNKNIAQIIMTAIVLLTVFYVSFQSENMMNSIAENGVMIHQKIIGLYYPAMAYTQMVTSFSMIDLIVFVLINILLVIISVFTFQNLYYYVNSKVKGVKIGGKARSNKVYSFEVISPMKALMKKEWNRFINTPVLVVNSVFGLLLFLVGCIAVCINFDGIVTTIAETEEINLSVEQIQSYIPAILFGLICFASLMSSITSSVISLEGKAFSILKSVPVHPFLVLISKIFAAVIIMLPFILIGDVMIFARFSFHLGEILMILIASLVLPIVSQTIGIIINLKYPKLDAENDSEVVKQSNSSMIAVFVGIILTMVTVVLIIVGLAAGFSADTIILIGISFYSIIAALELWYLSKKGVKEFLVIE